MTGLVIFSSLRGFFALCSCLCPLDAKRHAVGSCHDLRSDLRFVWRSASGSKCHRRWCAAGHGVAAASPAGWATAYSCANPLPGVYWARSALAPQMASQVSHGKLFAEFELPWCISHITSSSMVSIPVVFQPLLRFRSEFRFHPINVMEFLRSVGRFEAHPGQDSSGERRTFAACHHQLFVVMSLDFTVYIYTYIHTHIYIIYIYLQHVRYAPTGIPRYTFSQGCFQGLCRVS